MMTRPRANCFMYSMALLLWYLCTLLLAAACLMYSFVRGCTLLLVACTALLFSKYRILSFWYPLFAPFFNSVTNISLSQFSCKHFFATIQLQIFLCHNSVTNISLPQFSHKYLFVKIQLQTFLCYNSVTNISLPQSSCKHCLIRPKFGCNYFIVKL